MTIAEVSTEIEGCVSGTLLERGRFRLEPRRAVATEFIEAYSRIVEAVETNQPLRIVEERRGCGRPAIP